MTLVQHKGASIKYIHSKGKGEVLKNQVNAYMGEGVRPLRTFAFYALRTAVGPFFHKFCIRTGML